MQIKIWVWRRSQSRINNNLNKIGLSFMELRREKRKRLTWTNFTKLLKWTEIPHFLQFLKMWGITLTLKRIRKYTMEWINQILLLNLQETSASFMEMELLHLLILRLGKHFNQLQITSLLQILTLIQWTKNQEFSRKMLLNSMDLTIAKCKLFSYLLFSES